MTGVVAPPPPPMLFVVCVVCGGSVVAEAVVELNWVAIQPEEPLLFVLLDVGPPPPVAGLPPPEPALAV